MAIASAPLSEAPFLVGTAISVWQNSGGAPTNWATWAAKRNILGMSTIKGGDKVLHESFRSRQSQTYVMRCCSRPAACRHAWPAHHAACVLCSEARFLQAAVYP